MELKQPKSVHVLKICPYLLNLGTKTRSKQTWSKFKYLDQCSSGSMQEIIFIVFFGENEYVENRTQDDEVQLLFRGELGTMRAHIKHT